MLKQDLPELTELVRSLIKKHGNHNDVIYNLCQATKMDWSEAEALVRRVEATYYQHYTQEAKTGITDTQRLGSLVFLFCIVLLIATPTCGLVQYQQWHTPSAPIVRNVSGLPVSVHPGTLKYWTWRSRYERTRWAEAGQVIVVNYDVTPESGSLTITVDKESSLLCHVSQQDWEAFQHYTAITKSDQGKMEIPVVDSCLYRLSVGLYSFTGQMNISWEIKQP